MKKVLCAAASVAALLAMGGIAHAQDTSGGPWAAGVTAGTDGLGADLKYALSPSVVLRLRGAGLDVRHGENSDGIHYNGHLMFTTGGGFLDWHPMSNGWLVSAGVVGGRRQLDLSGTSTSNVTIDGNTYTPAQIGTVFGHAKLPSAAGFLGVGYDSTYVSRGPIGFNVLAGVQFSGSAKVTLTSTGLLAATPQLQADLAHEEANIRHDLGFARYYPAVSVGVTYRF
jgi:hypothetical protein